MLLTWASSRARPSLVLNFLQGIADPRITYSGGTNGTRVNSSGVIVAATTPRFDYNPVTLAARGLLVEEARTNLLTYSQEFDNAAWPRFGTTSITANAVTSPDGTTNADLLTMTSAGSGTFQAATGAASTAYTGTIYLRAAAPVTVNLILTTNLADPVIVACAVTTAWQRFTVNKTTSIGTTTVALQVSDTGAGNSSVYLWGAQLEAGAFPTSYIPTTSASVTRTADSAVMTGTNFSSWYNQSEGTFVVSADVLALQSAAISMDVGAGGAFGTTAYVYQTTGLLGVGPPAAPVNMDSSVVTVALSNKYAVAMAANNTRIAVNGTLGGADTTCTMPASATTLTIGKGGWSGAANNLNGHIQTITYFPRRSANEQLQALTA